MIKYNTSRTTDLNEKMPTVVYAVVGIDSNYKSKDKNMTEPRCHMCMETFPGSLKDKGGYVVYDMYYNA